MEISMSRANISSKIHKQKYISKNNNGSRKRCLFTKHNANQTRRSANYDILTTSSLIEINIVVIPKETVFYDTIGCKDHVE